MFLKTNILFVDDNEDLLKIAIQLLIRFNSSFHFETGNSGEEALRLLSKNRYDIIVSDYQMPGMDGLQLLKQIRENKDETPFIMFTGKGRESVAMQALNLGADYYLMKENQGIDSLYAELNHIIQKVVNEKRNEKELMFKNSLTQVLLDALPCVALVLNSDRTIIFSNQEGKSFGAFPGKNCYSTWGQRPENPCPWCLAPKALKTGKPQSVVVDAVGSVWDAYWIPLTKDIYLHYAFDITNQQKNLQIPIEAIVDLEKRVQKLIEIKGLENYFNRNEKPIIYPY